MILKFKKYGMLFVSLVFIFGFSFFLANAGTGTIDDTNKTALLCTNDACTTTTRINFKPSSLTGNQIISITDDEITGYAWSETFGWINMSPTTSGVKNDGEGNLSGYAWGQNAGWINFNPTQGGVIINPTTGQFSGWAWAQNYGWIKFDCSATDGCLKTDWSADSDEEEIITPPTYLDLCPNIPGNQTSTASYDVDGNGNCIIPLVEEKDLCPNIPGVQTSTESYDVDGNGNCIIPLVEEKDLCLIDGIHQTIPSGYKLENGLCVKIITDVCPNLEDEYSSVPAGYIIQNNNCIPSCDAYPSDTACAGTPEPEDSCDLNPSHPSCVSAPVKEEDKDERESPLTITQNTIDDMIENLNEALLKIKDVLNTQVGEATSSAVAVTGLLSGALMGLTTALFANPLVFSELFFIPMRIWSLILAALGIRRKNRPWGTVYDSVTKQPLDPAYVVLQDLNGNEVATSITDLDGRYGFLVEPGQYRIIANKTNYDFPSKRLVGKTNDELYHDLYFNEIIEIKEEGEVIIKNIPMDPLKFDWNEFAKKDQKLMKFYSKRDVFIAKISNILFFLGLFITIVAVIAHPKTYNLIILGIYVLLFILRNTILKKKPFGSIVEAFNGNPLSFAVIRVFSSETNHEIIHKVTDKTGKYYCLIPNGTYYVRIDRKNTDATYTTVFTSETISVTKGYIGKKFKI